MRGDVVYRVYGLHEGREQDQYFDCYRTAQEAEARIAELKSKPDHWSEKYHNKGFVIREAVVDTDFEIPSLPKPRDNYAVRISTKPSDPGTWDSTLVQVFRRDPSGDHLICEYERNYSMFQTFEPFRQGQREFALVSRDYTKSAVLDLASGEVIAEEAEEYYGEDAQRPGAGFCPVGFFVPDWWDVHDDSVIPGSEFWDEDDEWPTGGFGFVWGCHWGDDSSWKVQHLDLSCVRDGVIKRDDRFGYIELATIGYTSPVFRSSAARTTPSRPPEFIRLWSEKGVPRVTFAVELEFDLRTGKKFDSDVS